MTIKKPRLLEASLFDMQEAYDFVCELEQYTFDKALFEKQWQHNLKDASIQYYFLINEEHKKVGFCSLRYNLHLHHCDYVAQIEEFIVDQQERRKGYGTMMFAFLKEVALAKHCFLLELSSRDIRKEAHSFYKAQGIACIHYKFTSKLT